MSTASERARLGLSDVLAAFFLFFFWRFFLTGTSTHSSSQPLANVRRGNRCRPRISCFCVIFSSLSGSCMPSLIGRCMFFLVLEKLFIFFKISGSLSFPGSLSATAYLVLYPYTAVSLGTGPLYPQPEDAPSGLFQGPLICFHRLEQVIIGRRNIWGIRRVG